MAVLTITWNPAIDKTYYVDELMVGHPVRVRRVMRMAGGKGLNVLRVLRTLGISALGTGFLAGHAGRWIAEQLDRMELPHAFQWIDGETRSTITIIEEATGRITEVLESGPVVTEDAVSRFLEYITPLLQGTNFVTLSGSLAPGLPADYLATVVRLARTLGVNACVDAYGAPLHHALEARPYIVKINHQEFADWLGCVQIDTHLIAKRIQELNGAGAHIAVVTYGEQGSYLSTQGHVWHAALAGVSAVNPVGSGDAYLAGLVAALERGWTLVQAMELATAVAASNALQPVAGQVDVKQAEALARQVTITQLQ